MSSSIPQVKVEDRIPTNEEPIEVSRSIRDAKPSHYILKIKSFSLLSESRIERYESDDFEVDSYKWKLCLYPNGNKNRNGSNHISLYLVISDTKSLPQGWEANVHFKFFVYDHIRDNYLTIQEAEGRTRRFYGMKTERGFAKFLPLDLFKNPSKGYLFDDSCAFGAEVFVRRYSGKGQCLSMIKDTQNNTYTWKIDHFSSRKEDHLNSDEFKVGEQQWKLLLHPRGDGKAKGKSISLYLVSIADKANVTHKREVYVEFKLRIRDQSSSKHYEKEVSSWFRDSIMYQGYQSFMLLNDLNDTSKGFIVNNTLIVEAEIKIMAKTTKFT